MFLSRLKQVTEIGSLAVRYISRTPIRSCNIGANAHKVNNLEKRFLVWTGKFKKVDDVPNYVAMEIVEKARNKMRIRLANIMILLTLVACLGVSISGKRAHERGESVLQDNLAWHQSIREEAVAAKVK